MSRRTQHHSARLRRRPHVSGLLALLCGAALTGPFQAQAQASSAQTLSTPQQVGASLQAATSEVMLVTPALRSREVAEGLRRAATERGVRVYLLADARYLNDGASYLGGLSMVKGIQVRLVQGLSESRATIDRRVTVSGPLLADIADPLRVALTQALQEPRAVAQAANWFSRAWAQARPYRYEVPDLAPKKAAAKPAAAPPGRPTPAPGR